MMNQPIVFPVFPQRAVPSKGVRAWVLVCILASSSIAASAWADEDTNRAGNAYLQHNLVSDGFVPADHTDTNLVNAWGLTFNPNGPAWVADNGTGVSTLYDGNGNPQPSLPLVVTIPGGSPTGVVFNSSADFVVSNTKSGPSTFIFATENGVIAGWNHNVDPTNAISMVDNSASTGAIYKGIALAANGTDHMLYATDFHNGRIDVFDKHFQPVSSLPSGAFTDPRLPAGFAPFGIQNIGGDLYVTYAKQDADRHDDVHGPGLGFVDIFNANGQFVRRLITRGQLNSPWGMAVAPADFGKFGNTLLVGNFGDGTINAFDLETGNFRGQLRRAKGRPIMIDGLWGLSFGNGVLNQATNTLFFTAGPVDESHGLYGRIDPEPSTK